MKFSNRFVLLWKYLGNMITNIRNIVIQLHWLFVRNDLNVDGSTSIPGSSNEWLVIKKIRIYSIFLKFSPEKNSGIAKIFDKCITTRNSVVVSEGLELCCHRSILVPIIPMEMYQWLWKNSNKVSNKLGGWPSHLHNRRSVLVTVVEFWCYEIRRSGKWACLWGSIECSNLNITA